MYKFNGGNGAVVCDGCSIIMEQNIPFEKYRKEHSGYDFCEQCLSNLTIVDNFDMIENILEFNSQDEFYFLQIIQRKKDGNITQIGNNGYRTIKTYYIFSKDPEYLKTIITLVNECRGVEENKVRYQIPTLHGII